MTNFRLELAKAVFILFISTMSSGCGPGPQLPFTEKNSPDNKFTVRIDVSEPKKILGCEFCRRPFYIYATIQNNLSSENFNVFETRLENDGVPFNKQNISLRWVSRNTLIVCLRASDLPKRGYHVTMEKDVLVSDLNNC